MFYLPYRSLSYLLHESSRGGGFILVNREDLNEKTPVVPLTICLQLPGRLWYPMRYTDTHHIATNVSSDPNHTSELLYKSPDSISLYLILHLLEFWSCRFYCIVILNLKVSSLISKIVQCDKVNRVYTWNVIPTKTAVFLLSWWFLNNSLGRQLQFQNIISRADLYLGHPLNSEVNISATTVSGELEDNLIFLKKCINKFNT